MHPSTNKTNIIELQDADYLEPQRYTPVGIIQTSFNQEVSGIIYNVYINEADTIKKETTLVFDSQSEERARTHEANRLMASWLTR